jgi:hypothetical protein
VRSVDLLLDVPAIPRVLRLLLDRQGEERHASVVEAFPDRTLTISAIDVLEAQGIVRRENGFLKVVKTEETTRQIEAVILFYERLNRTERKKLLFRGILNSAQYACLVHYDTFVALMEGEGFGCNDVKGMVDADGGKGLVERLTITYRERRGQPKKMFPFIPLHYYPHFLSANTDDPGHIKERLARAGVVMAEEEYLLGHYPKEMADQAREYIDKEKGHIRERIKNEAFDIWWYYRF